MSYFHSSCMMGYQSLNSHCLVNYYFANGFSRLPRLLPCESRISGRLDPQNLFNTLVALLQTGLRQYHPVERVLSTTYSYILTCRALDRLALGKVEFYCKPFLGIIFFFSLFKMFWSRNPGETIICQRQTDQRCYTKDHNISVLNNIMRGGSQLKHYK